MTCASLGAFMEVIRPYIVPPTFGLAVRAYGSFFLLAASRTCNILSPILLADAVDVMKERFPWEELVAFAALRIGAS